MKLAWDILTLCGLSAGLILLSPLGLFVLVLFRRRLAGRFRRWPARD